MTKIRHAYRLVLILLTPFVGLVGQGNHYLHLNIHKQGSAQELIVYNTYNASSPNSSNLYESNLDMSAGKALRFHRMSYDEDYSVSFTLQNAADNDLNFGFYNFDTNGNGIVNYSFEFFPNGQNKVKAISPFGESSTYDYTSNTIFQIAKCGAKFNFYIGGELVLSKLIDVNYTRYELSAELNSIDHKDLFIEVVNPYDCPPPPVSKYLEVNSEIPVSYSLVDQDKVGFYFMQKYFVQPDDPASNIIGNDEINIEVYNYKRDHLASITKKIKYGANYVIIDIAQEIPSASIGSKMLFEINGANKDEAYYLKVHYTQ